MQNPENLTPVFVIGAMKAGTTTIFNTLRMNSEICFPIKKEPSYFCDKMGNQDYKKEPFFNLFNFNKDHKFFYDGSTNYTKYPAEKNVPQNIFESGLKPKFIYVVRNPFERIESHYNYTKNHPNWKENKITADYLINISNYYLQLSQFIKYFDKSEFLIIDFEDLKQNQQGTLERIHDFIGLTATEAKNQPKHANKTKEVNRTELKIKNKLGGSFGFLPKNIKTILKKVLGLFLSKKRTVLSMKQKTYIHSQLSKDMKAFGNEYNFNVEKWGF